MGGTAHSHPRGASAPCDKDDSRAKRGLCLEPFKAHFRRLHARAFVVTACWWRARCKSLCDIGALPQHIAADGHSSDPSIHRRPRSNARKTCSSVYDSWILAIVDKRYLSADARMNVKNLDSFRTGALLLSNPHLFLSQLLQNQSWSNSNA